MKHFLKGIMVLLLASPVWAGGTQNKILNMWQALRNLEQHWFVSFAASENFATCLDDTQNFPTIDSSHYSFKSKHTPRANSLGFYAGKKWLIDDKNAVQLGLLYRAPLNAFHVKGILTQGVNPPSYDFYPYQYHVRSEQLLLEGKFSKQVCKNYFPYAVIGVGGAFNRSYDYRIAYNPFLSYAPIFADKKRLSFSYEVGLGLDYALSNHYQLGISYRLNDLGDVGLGKGVINVHPIKSLANNHTLMHTANLELTYLF